MDRGLFHYAISSLFINTCCLYIRMKIKNKGKITKIYQSIIIDVVVKLLIKMKKA